ncbi:MAG TPA: amidohydrolase family protein [Stellaceae bacterium]|nr:amidohydrolase family protein [Stellaceae bacterium]
MRTARSKSRRSSARLAPKKAAAKKAAPKKAARKARARRPVVIDFHAHIVMPEILAATYEQSLYAQCFARKGPDGRAEPIPDMMMGRMTDTGQRLAAMDAMGVDIQVVSPSILHQCSYALPDEEALSLERTSNDRVAELVAKRPDRLIGVGSVPLQNVALAVAELERAVRQLGLKGVVISSHVNGAELGDPRHDPFWEKAQGLDAAIFMHPAGNTDPRMKRHGRLTSIGQQVEEALAVSSLVYDGVMDRFPRLKIAIAHGGGFLPYYAGRLDFFHRSGYSRQLQGDFSSYLPRFFFDSIVFNRDMLEFLAHKVPAGQIMLGSDYPFGESDPVAFVRGARRLPGAAQDAIVGANAARFLGMSL